MLISAPSGYDKSAFCSVLSEAAPLGPIAHVSLDRLDGSPAALFGAMSAALQLDAGAHRLPPLLRRFPPAPLAQLIRAAAEDLQGESLRGALVILDGTESLSLQACSALLELLIQTGGRVTPRVVVCTRSEEQLPLREAGVPVFLITDGDLALSDCAAGSPDGRLIGWPLAVRMSLTGQSRALLVLLSAWIGQLDAELLISLENATVEPCWPPAPGIMAALEIQPDFVSRALMARLPIVRQADGTYRPHPLLLDLLKRRLSVQSARHRQLQQAYARIEHLDGGKVLGALLHAYDPAQFSALVAAQGDLLPQFVRDHAETFTAVYRQHGLQDATSVLVVLARLQAETGELKAAWQMLTDARALGADHAETALAEAFLWSLTGAHDNMLASLDQAVLHSGPETAQGAAVRAAAALGHVTLKVDGHAGADVFRAQLYAAQALGAHQSGPVSIIAHVVLGRIAALGRQGPYEKSSLHTSAAFQEAQLLRNVAPDLFSALLLLTEQLGDDAQHEAAALMVGLLSRHARPGSAEERVLVPLVTAYVALRSAQPTEALVSASRAFRNMQSGARTVSRAVQIAVAETLLSAQVFTRQTDWTSPESRALLASFHRLISAGQNKKGVTLDALQLWKRLPDDGSGRIYKATRHLLPELLDIRSPLYIPLLVLITRNNQLQDGIQRLQEARVQFGAGTLQSAVQMLAPEMSVPESPRLEVTLFGEPQVRLCGRAVNLRPRAMVALAVLIVNGPTSRVSLAQALESEPTRSTAADQAIGDLRKALLAVTADDRPITQASATRLMYSLQRYDVTCDYFRLPSLGSIQRRDLIEQSFMRGFDHEWVKSRRAEFSALIGLE